MTNTLQRSVDGLANVLAIELLTAARALDLRAPLEPARATGAVLAAVRERIQGVGPDRWMSPEIEAAYHLITDGSVVRAAQAAAGELE